VTIVVVLLAIVVALLTVLVAGLLRSHAAILRKLHDLGHGLADELDAAGHRHDGDEVIDLAAPPRVAPGVVPPPATMPEGAAGIVGIDPSGDAVAVAVSGTAHDTVLAFLSSDCATCRTFWGTFADGDLGLDADTRLVVVTKGPEHESPGAVAELATGPDTVVMSSEAWQDYEVPGSPFFVLVDGTSGRIQGAGTAGDWNRVRQLIGRAASDAASPAARARRGAVDVRREEDLDEVLYAAGITPDDPSLYQLSDGTSTEDPR
jgi:hypothetical protein